MDKTLLDRMAEVAVETVRASAPGDDPRERVRFALLGVMHDTLDTSPSLPNTR